MATLVGVLNQGRCVKLHQNLIVLVVFKLPVYSRANVTNI